MLKFRGMSRALFLLALLCLLGLSNAAPACNSLPPDVSPAQESPIVTTPAVPIVSVLNPTFVWTPASFTTECEGERDVIYKIFCDKGDSGQVTTAGILLCTTNVTNFCTINSTGLAEDQVYQWAVGIITNNATNTVYLTQSLSAAFKWCTLSSPGEPILEPTNATVEYQGVIEFAWSVVDFGKHCTAVPNKQYRVIIFNNDTEKVTTLSDSNVKLTYDMGLQTPLSPGLWYWQVVASNGNRETESAILNFTVLPRPPVECNPICIPNQGVCNTTNGLCDCFDGYIGPICVAPSNNTGPPPTDAPLPIGLIAGLSVAGGLVVILIIVLAIVFTVYRRKHADIEMSILIEPPDFEVVALEPFNLQATPFVTTCSKKSSWKFFEQVVLADDFTLVLTLFRIAKISEMETLSNSLVVAFESHGAGPALVQRLILRELHTFQPSASNNEANPMPFRGDSAATKTFKAYCRLVGLPYLFETLGQIVNDFCALLDESKKSESPEDPTDNKSTTNLSRKQNYTPASMEVDPNRMNSDEDETINRLSLQLICQKIFVQIYRSVNIFPQELRLIFQIIRQESSKLENLRGVDMNVLLSNLVFLRFINPAIIVPRQFGILKEDPSDGTKRQLVLITKVLQNLAAGVEFGKKESFMIKLNDFIRQNSAKMNTFLSELSENIDTSNPPQISVYSAPISQLVANSALANVYSFVFNHQQEVYDALKEDAPSKAEPIIRALKESIQDMGDPASYNKK